MLMRWITDSSRRKIAYRPVRYTGALLIILSLASCTNYNQTGTGNSICANNATCSGQASAAQSSPQPDPDSDPSAQGSGSAPSPTFKSAAPTPVKVTLATLCNAPNTEVWVCGPSYGATENIGSTLFTYYGATNPNGNASPPYWDLVLQFPATTCTRLVMNFATASPNETAYLQLIQSHSQPKTASAYNSIGTLKANLDGGPFELQGDSSDGSQVVVNGYAICKSPSGE